MRIHILFPFQNGSRGGGGSHFLKALREEWRAWGVYEEDIEKADVILFNSHHWLKRVFKFKKRFPDKVFLHRVDGPLQFYRTGEKFLDRLIFKINSLLADGIIWQSNWSQRENKKLFPYCHAYETVIYNAPNNKFFNRQNKTSFTGPGKIKLIAASWSTGAFKGFDVYRYLDENLDFKRYEMIFVGRAPVNFKKIKMLGLMSQEELARVLKQQDIFIAASKIESCSNVLVEALSCGLPVVAFKGSSNPEIVGKGGELFESPQELLRKITKVAKSYEVYQENLPVFSSQKTAKQYFDFAKVIFDDSQSGFYFPRQVGFIATLSFNRARGAAFRGRALNKLKRLYRGD